MAQYLEYLKSPFKSLSSSISDSTAPNVHKQEHLKSPFKSFTSSEMSDSRAPPSVHKHMKQLEPHYTSYSLNMKKAIVKKIVVSECDAVMFTEYKVGNLVFTLQTGYYELSNSKQ